MSQETSIQLFENAKIRVVWDDDAEKYFFSVVDVIAVLTESANPQTYWRVLKKRLSDEGFETVTNCNALKLPAADGKMRLTDVADLEQILRIVQSVPSKKAEPLKRWLAQVGSERIQQMIDPELAIQQAVADYKKQGYSDKWIANRVKSIDARNELTNEWKRSGMQEGRDFAILTDLITKAWSGKTTKEYKKFKGLTKENLRDNMSTIELALNTLAEASTTEISKRKNPRTMQQNMQIAKEGGNVAKAARNQLEATIGESVVSPIKASDYIRPIEEGKAKELPFENESEQTQK
ncbi:MAG: hypothetical protein IJ718_03600 [Paludibacteraceae bacterium]|nr:hypothetical protein [Paludibacteraceae bacterium]